MPRYFLHQLGMLLQRLGDRHEQDAGLGEFLLEGGRDRHRIEHRIDRDARASAILALDAEQRLPLAQRNAELLVGLEDFGVDLVERLRAVLLLRRRIVVEVLVVDRTEFDARPSRLAHGEPAPIGVEPPGEHPVGLALLGRDEADDILGQALGGLVGFDQRLEPILILVDVDAADPIDGLLHVPAFFPPLRFQGPRVGSVGLWSFLVASGSPLLHDGRSKRRCPSSVCPLK